MIAVVKANAYGHGAVPVSRALAAAGGAALGVATLAEARELREAGVSLPILLLEGLHSPDEADEVLGLDLVPMVGALEDLAALGAAAARAGSGARARRPVALHLKLDTGMSRLGLLPDQLEPALDVLDATPALRLTGLASHLASADDARAATTAAQRTRFAAALAHVRARGFAPDEVHVDNSAGVVHGPTTGTTAVRVGLSLYGGDPTREGGQALEPVMTLLTRVVRVALVPAGTDVGYGGAHTTERATRIVTLPLGYADGLPRAAGGRFSIGLGDRRLPLVGRVSMDLATADAGPPDPGDPIEPGREVLVFGRRASLTIRVEELAAALGTIPYEVMVGIGPRVPRVYTEVGCSASTGSGGGSSRG